ncbi:MAG: glycogen/starch synthase [Bacteroidetes bacterium]|jgi:starch synthase|nr:glycogen/starch synthase [Bacteroidota bacterium]
MSKHFVFVAAENDGIKNCKAGGMGDVVRDVPGEIAKSGHQISVITPAYGRLHLQDSKLVKKIPLLFRGNRITVDLYAVTAKNPNPRIHHYVVHHEAITSGNLAQIYHHDTDEPFATDANKFALFCRAVAKILKEDLVGKADIVHLHDWHTALILLLRASHPYFKSLQNIRFVFSIHNLALQGIRPITNNASSLRAWYPELEFDENLVSDTRYTHCINLMGIGIRLADAIHTVSPTYKNEILMPSEPPVFIGGEGLENDLVRADTEKRLFGILNGIHYHKNANQAEGTLLENCMSAIFNWLTIKDTNINSDFLVHTGKKLATMFEKKPSFIAASVARLTDQKFFLYKKYPEVFGLMLDKLKSINGIYILLGTGDLSYDAYFKEISHLYQNFIFINGQSDAVVGSIYREADLYLMPSLFEPCGISQMLAMQHGQPCLVHNTGGLKDTVGHMINGFTFGGGTTFMKAKNMLATFEEAIDMYLSNPEEWMKISKLAMQARFDWAKSVDRYFTHLYNLPDLHTMVSSDVSLKKIATN